MTKNARLAAFTIRTSARKILHTKAIPARFTVAVRNGDFQEITDKANALAVFLSIRAPSIGSAALRLADEICGRK